MGNAYKTGTLFAGLFLVLVESRKSGFENLKYKTSADELHIARAKSEREAIRLSSPNIAFQTCQPLFFVATSAKKSEH